MDVVHELDLGIVINGVSIKWYKERETVRQTLALPFKESDFVYDSSEFDFDMPSFTQRRDIYGDPGNGEYYFFLNYNENSQLIEFEAHHLTTFQFRSKVFRFGHPMQQVMDAFHLFSNKLGVEYPYFQYIELKMSIAPREGMGGDEGDDGLAYVYATANSDHFAK